MPRNLANDLMEYGNWSGRGYSAGTNTAGQPNRYLTPEEETLRGVDAFDNCVAKPHDLNEYRSERLLRQHLGQIAEMAAVINADLDPARPYPAYATELIYGGEDELNYPGVGAAVASREGEPRFVSYAALKDLADANNLSADGRREFANALFHYFSHVERSNLQFAVDIHSNPPTLREDATGAFAALIGAAHIFLMEAARAEAMQRRIAAENAAIFDPENAGLADYLNENFAFGSDMNDGDNPFNFRPGATRAQLLEGDGHALRKRYAALRDRHLGLVPAEGEGDFGA